MPKGKGYLMPKKKKRRKHKAAKFMMPRGSHGTDQSKTTDKH